MKLLMTYILDYAVINSYKRKFFYTVIIILLSKISLTYGQIHLQGDAIVINLEDSIVHVDNIIPPPIKQKQRKEIKEKILVEKKVAPSESRNVTKTIPQYHYKNNSSSKLYCGGEKFSSAISLQLNQYNKSIKTKVLRIVLSKQFSKSDFYNISKYYDWKQITIETFVCRPPPLLV